MSNSFNDPDEIAVCSLEPTRQQQAMGGAPLPTNANSKTASFWKSRASEIPRLELPYARLSQRHVTKQAATSDFTLGPELSHALRSFSSAESASVENLLVAGLFLLLARYADAREIAVLATFAGSDTFCLGLEGGATVLLQTRIADESSFRNTLRDVTEVKGGVLPYAFSSPEAFAAELLAQEPAPTVPLQVSVDFRPQSSFQGVNSSDSTGRQVLPELSVSFECDGKEIIGSLRYPGDLFEAETIALLGQHLINLLRGGLARPDEPAWRLQMLSAQEVFWLEHTLNQSQREFPALCTHDLIVQQAQSTPDRVAVHSRTQRVTYRQLIQQSGVLAEHLVRSGYGRESVVAVLLERSVDLVTTMLGVMRAGAVFLPLDPGYPVARLRGVCARSGARLLLTQESLSDISSSLCSVRMDVLEHLKQSAGLPVPDPELPPVPLTDPAYMIFTSGTTGDPKGVEISHGALANLIQSSVDDVSFGSADVTLAVTTICYDAVLQELLVPLVAGAQIYMASSAEIADPRHIRALLDSGEITVLDTTPALWRTLIEIGWTGSPKLTAITGGEPLTEPLAADLLTRARAVFNHYGPTETTVSSAYSRVTQASPITFEHAVANTTLYVLDSHCSLVPAGVVGELYIGGAGLAKGYFGQPALTERAFPSITFADGRTERLYRTGDRAKRLHDGAFEILGRVDRQIKLRGFRIELGEVEAALHNEPGVQHAVATKVEHPQRGDLLVAFVVPRQNAKLHAGELKAWLATRLPGFMVPSVICFMDRLPLLSSGKIDYSRLPDFMLPKDATALELPQPGMEQAIATIWRDLLGLKVVGRNESFLDLGGHSLLVARFIARANREFGRSFSTASFLHSPTIAQFALVVQGQVAPWALLVKPGSARKQLLWIGAEPWLMRLPQHLGEDLGLYSIDVDQSDFSLAFAENSLAEAAAKLTKKLRSLQPEGPFLLGGFCLFGLLAYEIAQQLQREGEDVALLVLADFYAPGRTPRWTPVQRVLKRISREIFWLASLASSSPRFWHLQIAERVHAFKKRRGNLRLNTSEIHPDLLHTLERLEPGYQVSPYTGRVLFLESTHGRLFEESTSASWRDLIDRMDVFRYSGGHENVLTEANLERAAEAIQTAIDRSLA